MKQLIIFLLLARLAFGAFSATTAWDVQTGGSDSNGGGFDTSATGTDKSQGAAAAFTDLIIGGTTTQGTSTTLAFDTTSPGNVINVTSGTGCTVQRVQISSQSSGTATFEKTLGTAGSTCTGIAYGPLATIKAASALSLVSGNIVWLKSGTYTASTSTGCNTNNCYSNWTSPGGTYAIWVIGYGSSHGDNGTKPLITTATNSIWLVGVNSNTSIYVFRNLSFSTTASTKEAAFFVPSNASPELYLEDCVLDGFQWGINGDNGSSRQIFGLVSVRATEIKNSVNEGIINQGTILVESGSWIHNNSGNGITQLAGLVLVSNAIVSNNTLKGISVPASTTVTLANADIVSNTGDGLNTSGTGWASIVNSIIYGNGGFGINATTSFFVNGRNNAFGSNSSGNTATTVTYKTQSDQALTASPFVSSTNLALNTTAGGGALLSAAGYPGLFGGGTTTGYIDIGAVEGGAGHCPAALPHAFACAH